MPKLTDILLAAAAMICLLATVSLLDYLQGLAQ